MTNDETPEVEDASDFMDFGTYDIEASNWNEVESIGVFDGNGYSGGDIEDFENQEHIVKFYVEMMLQHPDVDRWYAHNSGKYDIKFFLEYLSDNYYLEYCYVSSSLILVQVYEQGVEDDYEDGRYKGNTPKKDRLLGEFRDSLALFPMSLNALTKSFDVNHKKQEYDQYQDHEDRDKMMEYLKYDCIGLWEVIAEFMCRTNTPRLNLTIASQSMSVYKNRFDGNDYMDNLQSNGSREQDFRSAYFGGRTEVFNRYGEDLYYYDFHSMYPAVMRQEEFPSGELVRTSKVKPNKKGIYKIRWTSPDQNIPLLPSKTDEGKLLFPTGEDQTGWYYSPEVKQALEDGYDIEVIKGYYWTEKQKMFDDYIDHWYSIKQNSDGAMYPISKLFLNSLYGKFGQSREVTEITEKPPTKEQIQSEDWEVIDPELNLYSKPTEIFADYIYPYIAGFVTSYGRLKLYKALRKADQKGEVYYCDTDSLIIDHPLQTSPELGELGLEDKVKEGYFLYPKVYAYKDYDGNTHLKGKGFKSEHLKYQDYVKAYNGDMSGFTHSWDGLVGFLEKYSRADTSKFTDKIEKKKSLKGTFDKRKLHDDNRSTHPVHLND